MLQVSSTLRSTSINSHFNAYFDFLVLQITLKYFDIGIYICTHVRMHIRRNIEGIKKLIPLRQSIEFLSERGISLDWT